MFGIQQAGAQDVVELVKDIRPGSSSSNIDKITNVDGTLFFKATDGSSGSELWKSDGTATGTVMVKDINPGGGSDPRYFTDLNGAVVFQANDGTNGTELWKCVLAPFVPTALTVDNPQMGSVDVTIGSGDGNPAGTKYAIYCETTSQWVQANGSLGASEVWNTASGWGTRTVYVSSPDTYTFKVKARNGAGLESALGPGTGQYVVPVELSVFSIE